MSKTDSSELEFWFGEYWKALQTTYYISIGGFDPAEADLYPVFGWIVFWTCTLFNIIILTNLLIAIVSEIFVRVMEHEVENSIL